MNKPVDFKAARRSEDPSTREMGEFELSQWRQVRAEMTELLDYTVAIGDPEMKQKAIEHKAELERRCEW